MMYTILHEDQKMRCIVRYPGLREKRSSHLKGSVSTTRLMNRKSKFQGFKKNCDDTLKVLIWYIKSDKKILAQ